MPSQAPKVQFADHDIVYEIPHVNDMYDEEISAVFLTVGELRALREECKTLVRMIDDGLHVFDGKELFDTRGLEAHTQEYTRRASELRDNLYDSIHAAQCFQDAWGEDASDAIAQLSREVSAISTEIARATAKEDARAVRSKKTHRSSQRKPNKSAASSPSKGSKLYMSNAPRTPFIPSSQLGFQISRKDIRQQGIFDEILAQALDVIIDAQ
jgi:hypothetical protein